jgi:rubrerythrin
MRFLVSEVHNFGGFFGGDTVTLSGAEWRRPGAAEQTLMIDESALANLTSRHQVAAGMLLELTMAGERVDRAALLGAAGPEALRLALGDPPLAASLPGPLVLSHHCAGCDLWVPTLPDPERCPICGAALAG